MTKWWKNAVIYQIYPKSFFDSDGNGWGDLDGITSKLDYLHSLGVDALWLSPIYESPQVDNGYDISDYRRIDSRFGTMDDMQRLIDGAHERGIRVIMDLVVNHTSDEHDWFRRSRQSRDNPYSDYYLWRDPRPDGGPPNNWGSHFGGSAWEYCADRDQYYLHYYASKQPDLNWENPQVRSEIYDLMRFWMDRGVDGWRMDVIAQISKYIDFPDYPPQEGKEFIIGPMHYYGPRLHEFLREMHQEVLSKYDCVAIGEAPASTPEIARLLTDPERAELDMIFTFEHIELDRVPNSVNRKWDLRPMEVRELKQVLSKWQYILADRGWNALYFENHDRARIVSRWGNDTLYRKQCANAFATVLHGMQGTPFVYQGEEIGMVNAHYELSDYQDIDIKNAYRAYVHDAGTISEERFTKAVWQVGRDNARTPMQWDASKNAGFTSSWPWLKVNPRYLDINVAEALADRDSVFAYYQRLIALRHQEPILIEGSYELLLEDDPVLFVYERAWQGQRWLVIVNLSDQEQSAEQVRPLLYARWRAVIANYPEPLAQSQLRPYEACIVARMDDDEGAHGDSPANR